MPMSGVQFFSRPTWFKAALLWFQVGGSVISVASPVLSLASLPAALHHFIAKSGNMGLGDTWSVFLVGDVIFPIVKAP
jgi:hypothetical protein